MTSPAQKDIATTLKALDDAVASIKQTLYLDDKTPLGNALALQRDLTEARNEAWVLFLGDLDSFKEVNSEHGYEAGDAAISRAGDALMHAFAPFATTQQALGYRQGGDEFAVLAAPQVSSAVGSALADAFKRIHVAHAAKTFLVHGSFGWARAEPELPIEEWKKRAENALVAAKASATRRVVGWTAKLKAPPEKLRRRCRGCRANFSVSPTRHLTERELHCPQCGQQG